MTGDDSQPNRDYALGHAEGELERLIRQGQFYAEITERFLRDVGIREGQKVVDVGCGSGYVSFLLAKLVGPNGQVIAVDQSSQAITFAEARAKQNAVENVQFVCHNIENFTLPPDTHAI